MNGFVYFVGAANGNRIKIGFSADVDKRLGQLQTGSSERLHLLGFIPGSYKDEKYLHDYFSEKRQHGEWFNLDQDMAIKVSRIIKFKDIVLGLTIGSKLKSQDRVDKYLRREADVQLQINSSEIQKAVAYVGSKIAQNYSAEILRYLEKEIRDKYKLSRRQAIRAVSIAKKVLEKGMYAN